MAPRQIAPLPLSRGFAALELDELAAVARHLGLANDLTSKARLLNTLPERLTDAAAVKALIRSLGAEDTPTLLKAAAVERLAPVFGAKMVHRFAAAQPPAALAERGLLLPDVDAGFRRPPAEILAFVDDEAVRRLGTPAAKTPTPALRCPPGSAFRDAVNIWCWVIKNRVTLTHGGGAPKRALSKLSSLLEIAEEEDAFAAVMERFGASRLEVLVNEGHRRGALVIRDGELEAAPWSGLAHDPAPSFAADLATDALAEDASGGALLAAYRLALAPPEKWFAAADLVSRVQGVEPAAEPAAALRGLFATFVAGWLAAGNDEDARLVVARAAADSPGEKQAAQLLVGGNFEVKAPAAMALADRLKLEAFADQVGGGHYLSFVINKHGAYRAYDAGVSADEIISFLADRAGKPLPQNVEFSLRDWAAQYGAVYFRDGLVLAADTANLTDEIANLPGVAPYVRGRADLHVVEIAARDYEAVRAAIIQAGVLPRSLPGTGELPVSPRLLFDGGSPRLAEPVVGAAPEAVLAFAVERGRKVQLTLAGEGTPLAVAPRRLEGPPGGRRLVADGEEGPVEVPLAAVVRADLL